MFSLSIKINLHISASSRRSTTTDDVFGEDRDSDVVSLSLSHEVLELGGRPAVAQIVSLCSKVPPRQVGINFEVDFAH